MPPLDPDLRALQEVRDQVERARRALDQVARYDQARTDALCRAMAEAAARAAHQLARSAVEETGIGRVHYKVLKNLFGAEGTWASIQDERTVGVVRRDEKLGVIEVATPAGVIACVIPTTNPTSTAINNALIAVKGRNALVISPHPRARRCIGETVEVLRAAIERAGGPPDLVQSLSSPTIESTGALMRHKDVAVILATGGSGLVHAAYSSGKPSYGVGPGNVPVYVDRSADVREAARWITASQSFDNGTLCCSEQGLVLDRPVAAAVLDELVRRGAHVCDEPQTKALERLCNRGGHMNPEVVGQDPARVAEMAGFHVPSTTTILLAHQAGVGPAHPLSIEILCPLLSVHVVDGWEEGCEVSLATLRFGGLGHTIGLWARDEAVLDAWFLEKPANRIIVNGPTSEGAVGYSTNLAPAMSLGCGPQAGNITSDNISARHLINVKRVGFPKRGWEDLYVRGHERAAALTGERAPRGSGLPGDPAMAGTARPGLVPDPVATGASSWRGNPGSRPQAGAPAPRAALGSAAPLPAAAAGNPGPAPRSGTLAALPAPRFTDPGPQARGAAPQAPPGSAASPATPRSPSPAGSAAGATAVLAPPRTLAAERVSSAAAGLGLAARGGPFVGMALSPGEIQGILAHAGSGCPLGPCATCRHHDPAKGACLA